MPAISATRWASKTHPYYVRYVNNTPVAYRGPLEVVALQSTPDGFYKLYDYNKQAWVDATTIPQE